MPGDPFRLGTRGSALARKQATIVRERLERRGTEVELVEVTTEGDRLDDELIHRLGQTGAFVRDLDERVLTGELDGAVHSLKDMPTEMPDELIVAAIPERISPHDVLVSPDGEDIKSLPAESTVGTASLRRQAQLLAQRPELQVEPIRGNIDTRLEKLLGPHLRRERDELEEEDRTAWLQERSELERNALDRSADESYDALILATAGLERSNLIREVPSVRLSLDDHVPAPGQGAIAVTMCDTEQATNVHRRLDHPPSRVAATVERVILSRLGGGCIAPIGIHAVVQGEVVHTRVQVLSQDGSEVIATSRDLPVEQHVSAAEDFAASLADRGAAEIIATATE